MSTLTDAPTIELSIIIKTLNEATHIQRTIAAVKEAARNFSHEIIVADSLSDDDTAALAKAAGARVIQLVRREDRSCGIGAQLGFQIARGTYVYLLDGDMECIPGFIDEAITCLKANDHLAGVAGDMSELGSGNYEFQLRKRLVEQFTSGEWHGEKDWLDGGGIYKRVALDELGYITDRNLHAYEEKDLGLRLRSKGWRMVRIPLSAVQHRGHAEATWALLRKRWVSKYVNGAGELIRACVGSPHFWRAVKLLKQYVVLALLMTATVLATAILPWTSWPFAACLLAWALAALAMCIRKRGVTEGLRALAYLAFWSAGLIRGLVMGSRTDPAAPIESRQL
ncbi:glycosyltransferase [Roseateles sp. DAIF2]|uniref:glycosyltransferase n=1 Tax=Roseateles sp. DAIF2 TaxID=2714952 RepID=UPI0018A3266B|nr:glycosyltransferase [Roseateles sp. DAIF2]QPF75099.1 glycosyltransferase [Roseateles sp. DAIF2]